MVRRLFEIPEAVAHWSIGSVVVVASLVALGLRARREERLGLPRTTEG